MTTTTPDPRTLARTSDPDTSHAAAAIPRRTELIREGILTVLADGRPRTLDQIVEEYGRHARRGTCPPAAASSIRTRVAELRRDEQVERVVPDHGGIRSAATSRLGNPAGLYRIVPSGTLW